MLRAVGLTDDDWDKPQIGIASSWNEITPCNVSLRRLAGGCQGGRAPGGRVALEFGTITVSDGISMGHEGMRASLVSPRDHRRLGRGGDARRAARRAGRHGRLRQVDARDDDGDRPPGPSRRVRLQRIDHARATSTARRSTSRSVFEAIGACAAGTITEDELHAIERNACPGEGACGGMFTANTMSSIGEALGLSLPGSASPPAVDRRREDDAHALPARRSSTCCGSGSRRTTS